MWICASCGTEAHKPEVCSGCGSRMRPFDKPDRSATMFLLTLGWDEEAGYEQFIGPFPSVTEADQWWDQNRSDERFHRVRYHEVTLLEVPYDRKTET
jgi:hypothetical protein